MPPLDALPNSGCWRGARTRSAGRSSLCMSRTWRAAGSCWPGPSLTQQAMWRGRMTTPPSSTVGGRGRGGFSAHGNSYGGFGWGGWGAWVGVLCPRQLLCVAGWRAGWQAGWQAGGWACVVLHARLLRLQAEPGLPAPTMHRAPAAQGTGHRWRQGLTFAAPVDWSGRTWHACPTSAVIDSAARCCCPAVTKDKLDRPYKVWRHAIGTDPSQVCEGRPPPFLLLPAFHNSPPNQWSGDKDPKPPFSPLPLLLPCAAPRSVFLSASTPFPVALHTPKGCAGLP